MPRDSSRDGVLRDSKNICSLKSKEGIRNTNCSPLTQIYFNQYQYMPFYIASLAIFYYLPYILFQMVNSDIIALKKDVSPPTEADISMEKGASHVVNTYFRYDTISK